MASTRRPAQARRRDEADAAADRTALSSIITDLRTEETRLRAQLRGLPAPAQRNPAQRRDATMIRTLLLLTRAQLVASGVAVTADREPVDA